MIDRDALLQLARALPDGTAVPVPVAWLRELLEDSSAPSQPPAPVEVDLTPEEAGAALQRSAITVRAYCNAGLFPGAWKMRHRQWRIPRSAIEAFQAAERKAHRHPKRAA